MLASFFLRFLWKSASSRFIKTQKKELGEYPAILTEQAWSIMHMASRGVMPSKSPGRKHGEFEAVFSFILTSFDVFGFSLFRAIEFKEKSDFHCHFN